MIRNRMIPTLLLTAVVAGGTALHVTAATNTAANAAASAAVAAIGKPAPEFTLTSPQGKAHALGKERQGQKATVVMFVATQCPVSNDYNERMAQLTKDYAGKKVRFIGINSNKQESIEEVAKHAKDNQLPFPVLIDVGNVVADTYNARVTPQVYLIDDKGVLRYMGRIDDSQNTAGIKKQDLREALDAVLAGRAVPTAETRAFGCSIKRMEKESGS